MNSVTRSMSNDPNPDSPRAVMRTYSSYGRSKPGEEEVQEINTHKGKYPTIRTMSRENLRVQAFSNILSKEGICQPSEQVHPSPQGHRQGGRDQDDACRLDCAVGADDADIIQTVLRTNQPTW